MTNMKKKKKKITPPPKKKQKNLNEFTRFTGSIPGWGPKSAEYTYSILLNYSLYTTKIRITAFSPLETFES